MRAIHTHNAPQAIGPYSQATYKKGVLFISGQLGIDPMTGELANSFNEQAELVFKNLKNILLAANMTFSNVVKVTVYIADMGNFVALNEIYKKFFIEPFPAREVVEVSRLPKNGAVEISLMAMDN